jgi:hypothetical protein
VASAAASCLEIMPHPLNAMTEQAISNARFFKIRNSTREML